MFTNIYCTLIALTAPRDEEKGATAVEYALIVAGIAVGLLAAVGLFGDALSGFFEGLGGQIGITGS